MLAGLSIGQLAVAAEQSKPKADEVILEEVIVTVQKHEELADKPIAVTEFNAEQRNLIGAATLAQMVDLTPGVSLNNFGLSIRGVGRGQVGTNLGSANSVAAYVNGFYNFDPNVIGENTLIGGNVQFLRGPQGTRYGRDAIGGAANLISRKPTDTFTGESLLGYGRYNWYTAGATVSGPINDRYKFRVGVQHFHQLDRTQKNVNDTNAGFNLNNLYLEGQLEGDVTDNLHFLLRSTTFQYDNGPGYTAPARYVPLPGQPQTTFQGALVPNAFFGYTKAPPSSPRVIDVDFEGQDKLEDNQVHILNADYNLGRTTLYYVGGYAEFQARGNSDLDNSSRRSYTAMGVPGVADGTVISTFQTNNYNNTNSYYSHELRLEGNDTSTLEWNVGLYYLATDYNERFFQSLPDVAALKPPPVGVTDGPLAAPNPERAFFSQFNQQRETSKAVFGQATYYFNPQWDLTLGLRYTEDDRLARTNFRFVYYDPRIVGPSQALDVTPALHSVSPRADDSGKTGRLALQYKPTDSTTLYTSLSRGYKASGFSLGTAVTNNVAKPEQLNAYELGVKQSLGRKLNGSLAVFYYDYNDLQIQLTGQNDLGVPTLMYTNGQARTYGAELQTTWTPVDALNLSLTYTYLNAQYSDDLLAFDSNNPTPGNLTPPPGTQPMFQNLNGKQLPRTPTSKASLAGYYAWNMAPGSIYLGGSVSYTGVMFTQPFNGDLYRLDSNVLTNLSLTWRAADNRYDVVLACSNLTDEVYPVAINISSRAFGNAKQEILGAPRFYSVQTRIRF